jgi:hypothetical protein
MKDYTKTVRSFYFLPFLTRPLPRTPSIISVEAVRSPTPLAVVAIRSRGRPLPGDAYSPLRLSTPLALSACCRGYLLIVVALLAAMAVRSHGRPLPHDARCRGHPLPHTVCLSSRPPAPRCCAAPRGRRFPWSFSPPRRAVVAIHSHDRPLPRTVHCRGCDQGRTGSRLAPRANKGLMLAAILRSSLLQ